MTGRKISKRACDGCKIRKIKCTYQISEASSSSSSTAAATAEGAKEGAAPDGAAAVGSLGTKEKCAGCRAVGIACTFFRRPNTRGPRKLRKNTIEEIANAQAGAPARTQLQMPLPSPLPQPQPQPRMRVGEWIGEMEEEEEWKGTVVVSRALGSGSSNANGGGEWAVRSRSGAVTAIPSSSLVLQLCVYRLRMFAIWPILLVEEIIATLQHDPSDLSTYALATAIGAATIAQLRIGLENGGCDSVTAERMEEECQRVRRELGRQRSTSGVAETMSPITSAERAEMEGLNLTNLRTTFFLHVYHENVDPGGLKSFTFLREAITMAQMMGLHRESSYEGLPYEEQQLRRRILWLLFVTERGIAIMHKLPVMIRPKIAFPSSDPSDENSVFPAFQKLVNLFWIFDKSGAFDILQDYDTGLYNSGAIEPSSQSRLDSLQKQLDDVPISGDSVNDVQTADIAVTRQWMRAVVWKASTNHGPVSAVNDDKVTYCSHPFQIAKDFLGVVCRLPQAAMEAHGPSMELKIYEIASSVTEAIASISRVSSRQSMNRPREILNQLHTILSSCRGGNQQLVSQLRTKISQVQGTQPMLIGPSSRIIEEAEAVWEAEEGMLPVDALPPDELQYMRPHDALCSPSTDDSASLSYSNSHPNSHPHPQQQQPRPFDLAGLSVAQEYTDFPWDLTLDTAIEMQFGTSDDFGQQQQQVMQDELSISLVNLDAEGLLDGFLAEEDAALWEGVEAVEGNGDRSAVWSSGPDGTFVI